MVIFNCPRCGYSSPIRTNIIKHLNRKKICNLNKFSINPKDYEYLILKEDFSELKAIEQISIQKNQIKEKDKQLKEKDKQIKELKNQIKEKDKQLKENEKNQKKLEIEGNNTTETENFELLDNKVMSCEIHKLRIELEQVKKFNKSHGNLYIMWNPMFEQDKFKIGCSKNPDQRLLAYSTSYSEKSEFKYVSKIFPDKNFAETKLFNKLKEFRVNQKREFFKIPLNSAIECIKSIEDEILT